MARKKPRTVEYRNLREKGKPRAGEAADRPETSRWWTIEPARMADLIWEIVDGLEANQTAVAQIRDVCERLYDGGAGSGDSILYNPMSGRLTYNLTAIVVDALTSRVTKGAIRSRFLTDGGDYRQQRRARKLSQFGDGIFYDTKFDALAPELFLDACIAPDGGMAHVFEDPATKRVTVERVMPGELWVDRRDGRYRKPTQMWRTKVVDREVALEAFGDNPEAVKAIKDCEQAKEPGDDDTISDGIAVCEAWHLPSGVDDNGEATPDGMHVIVCKSGVLLPPERWTRQRFPFARMVWKHRRKGWHSKCLVDELVGTQVEMNHLLIAMQRSFRALGTFKIWLENGTIPDAHLNNAIGAVLHGPKGSQPPQYIVPPALNPQYFDHFERVKQRGFETARLSQMGATGQASTGLDASGEARRIQHDIEGEGFQQIGKAYETLHLDVATLAIDVVRDIVKREKRGYEIRAQVSSSTLPGAKFLRTVDWRKVCLDEDSYVMKAYAVAALPNDPAGRLARVQEWSRAGFVDPDTARKLTVFPDVEEVANLLGAAEDWIMSTLDGIIEDGEYNPPDPLMNLNMAEKLCLQELSLGSAAKLDADTLDDLRTWLGQVQALKQKAATAGAALGAPAPGAPLPPGEGAVPMAPPTSPLLPPPGANPAPVM